MPLLSSSRLSFIAAACCSATLVGAAFTVPALVEMAGPSVAPLDLPATTKVAYLAPEPAPAPKRPRPAPSQEVVIARADVPPANTADALVERAPAPQPEPEPAQEAEPALAVVAIRSKPERPKL